jgi:hypothetical protein
VVGLHLASTFHFSTFPNVAKQHPLAPYLHTRRALKQGSWEPSTDNRYGISEGPLAPSDGWDVLGRWFPIYREATAADVPRLAGLKTLVRRFEDLYDAPFLLKNNHNCMCIGALAGLFPDARFVMVRRDLPEAVRSLGEARQRHGVALGRWWSAAPPQFLGRTFDTELEQVVATVWGLERYVEQHFAELDAARHTTISYEEFCADPGAVVDWVEGGQEGLRRRAGTPSDSFRASRVADEERAQLEARIAPIVARLASE